MLGGGWGMGEGRRMGGGGGGVEGDIGGGDGGVGGGLGCGAGLGEGGKHCGWAAAAACTCARIRMGTRSGSFPHGWFCPKVMATLL